MEVDLIPAHIRALVPYKPGKPAEELFREKGLTRIVKLASNENPWGASPRAMEAIQKIGQSLHLYPDPSNFELKSKLAQIYRLKPENITLGAGSEGIMGCIVRCFLNDQNEALTSEGAFIGFTVLAKSVNTRLVQVPLTPDYRFDVERVAKAITPRTKIIYIANPSNPTGTYITAAEWEWFIPKVPDHTLVVLDEAYVEFASHLPDYPDSQKYRLDNVITLRTFSKAQGLAGLRIGMGIGEQDLITNLQKLRHPFEPNIVAQKAALAALDDKTFLDKTISNNEAEKKKLMEFLLDQGLTPIPSAANFVMVPFSSQQAAADLAEKLLNLGIIIRPLPAFGLPHCVRISVGTPEEMEFFRECWKKLT